jgi:hypothetical protein
MLWKEEFWVVHDCFRDIYGICYINMMYVATASKIRREAEDVLKLFSATRNSREGFCTYTG